MRRARILRPPTMLDIPTEENTMTFTKFAVAAAAALLCAGSEIGRAHV